MLWKVVCRRRKKWLLAYFCLSIILVPLLFKYQKVIPSQGITLALSSSLEGVLSSPGEHSSVLKSQRNNMRSPHSSTSKSSSHRNGAMLGSHGNGESDRTSTGIRALSPDKNATKGTVQPLNSLTPSPHSKLPTLSHSKMSSDYMYDKDEALDTSYKLFAVVWNYCTPELCLPVKPSERSIHQICLMKALDLRSAYGNENLALTKCSCGMEESKARYSRVALVSLPGSGDNRVRGLLEQATGICTGSAWCDPGLRATHFCGEGLRDERLLVVKDHDPKIRWRGAAGKKSEYDAVVFLHRKPSEALVVEYAHAVAAALWEGATRKKYRNEMKLDSHVEIGEEYFRDNVEWDLRLREFMKIWESMVDHLLIKSKNRPVLLVLYENLKEDPLREVKRIVDFLGYNLPESVLKERIELKVADFYGHRFLTFDPFTPAQKELIAAVCTRVTAKLNPDIGRKMFVC